MLRISEMLESSGCCSCLDAAWRGMVHGRARGLHVHITALLKSFKAQDSEGRTPELLQSAQPFLSWEIPGDCSILQQENAPGSKWGLGGRGTHSIAKEQVGTWRTHPQWGNQEQPWQ